MEALTRLVSESFARHGFERPLDYRRLQWSRWCHCVSPHSLLIVPSKPGVFALAEEIGRSETAPSHPRSENDGAVEQAEANSSAARRMLAVAKFFDAEDMAYVLDRMLSQQNPMRARLASGRYFIRYVVIEDESQRRTICSALNQWIVNSTEKVTGIGSHFATSLELTPQTEHTQAGANHITSLSSERGQAGPASSPAAPLNSGAASNIHCPFPSGF